MRQVARLGDGWYGYDLTPEGLHDRLNSLDAALAVAVAAAQMYR